MEKGFGWSSPIVLGSLLLKRTYGGRQTTTASSVAATQGLVLSPRLFNAFINEWDDGTDSSLSKLVGDTKPGEQSTSEVSPSLSVALAQRAFRASTQPDSFDDYFFAMNWESVAF